MAPVLGTFLCPPEFAAPQGVGALLREGSAGVEMLRHARHVRGLRRARALLPYAGPHRRAAVEPVLLVPGFMAGDWSLLGMAAALRHHGYRTYRSDIVVNAGCTRRAADRLEERLEQIVERRGRPVTLVGHSLGGMLARALAGRRPDLVAGIVTLGSPVLAPGAVHRLLSWDADLLARLTRAGFGGLMGRDCLSGPCAELSWEQMQAPLPEGLAYTAIYSRRDGIVDWRSCLDPYAEHVEVRSSHCGMAVDPGVLAHVLTALEQVRTASPPEARGGSAGSLHAVSR